MWTKSRIPIGRLRPVITLRSVPTALPYPCSILQRKGTELLQVLLNLGNDPGISDHTTEHEELGVRSSQRSSYPAAISDVCRSSNSSKTQNTPTLKFHFAEACVLLSGGRIRACETKKTPHTPPENGVGWPDALHLPGVDTRVRG